jgi:hypothetical protein
MSLLKNLRMKKIKNLENSKLYKILLKLLLKIYKKIIKKKKKNIK